MEIGYPAAVDDGAIEEQARIWYGAAQEAVESFGGVVAVAAAGEQPAPKVSMRLRRADDGKGNRHYARLDDMAIATCDPKVRAVVLAALADAWGFEPPVPKRVATEQEQLAALLDEIGEMNGAGKDLLRRAAKRLGADAGAFRRPR